MPQVAQIIEASLVNLNVIVFKGPLVVGMEMMTTISVEGVATTIAVTNEEITPIHETIEPATVEVVPTHHHDTLIIVTPLPAQTVVSIHVTRVEAAAAMEAGVHRARTADTPPAVATETRCTAEHRFEAMLMII
jgi:hypothetical protein